MILAGLLGAVMAMGCIVLIGFAAAGFRRPNLKSAVPALAVGITAGLLTGWPVAVLIGAAAGYGLPRLFGQTRSTRSVAKIEAIATWTEMLQATMAASSGLTEAILSTASLSPEPIRPAALQLSRELSANIAPSEALTRFAVAVDDAGADRVVCALRLAASARAQHLGELLTALAESSREEATMQLRIETSRVSVRSGIRTVIVFSVAFAVGLVVLAHSYLQPFSSETGQVMLAVIGCLYGTGLVAMVVLARPTPPLRLLGSGVERS